MNSIKTPNKLSGGITGSATEATANNTARHRPDIDGLRAIAVICVVIFHLQKQSTVLTGGFIGVDVFFVISGFLLTGIIEREIASKQFSLARFYERRARRILPALIAMLLVTTLIGAIFLLPNEFASYAKSLLAATFSYSNLYFWSNTNYFDPAESQPLLHTWSLAVEEQFYVVLPFALIALSRFARSVRLPLLVVATLCSFCWSVWSASHHPTAAFYSPLSRAWELLAGSLLAIDVVPKLAKQWLREFAALLGILLIAYAALRLHSGAAFPGFAALLPCVGSLLVLAAGRDGRTIVGSILSIPPLAFIGLISYSIYIWHYPLFVFARMGLTPLPNHWLYFPMMTGLALLMGALSWKFVEQPFRVGSSQRKSPRFVLVSSALAMASCGILAIIIISRSGFETRFPQNAVAIAASEDSGPHLQGATCFLADNYLWSDFVADTCMSPKAGQKNYLLLGDSHAAALHSALAQDLPDSHLLAATAAGCNVRVNISGSDDCSRLSAYVFSNFLLKHKVDGIFVSGRWRLDHSLEQLGDTIAWCKQRRIPVYVLGIVMEYNGPLPRLIAYSLAYHNPAIVQRAVENEMFGADVRLGQLSTEKLGVPYISLMDVQCPARHCIEFADRARTVPMLFDDNHLTKLAARKIVDALVARRLLPN